MTIDLVLIKNSNNILFINGLWARCSSPSKKFLSKNYFVVDFLLEVIDVDNFDIVEVSFIEIKLSDYFNLVSSSFSCKFFMFIILL